MKNEKKIYIILLCIGIILIQTLSFYFIAHEINHNCTGEECPICEQIEEALQLLENSNCTNIIANACSVLFFCLVVNKVIVELVRISNTLVKLKVKLSC